VLSEVPLTKGVGANGGTAPHFLILCTNYRGVKKNEMGRACSMNGEERNAYRIFVGNPEGKRPL
jgi:hypothetical protein